MELICKKEELLLGAVRELEVFDHGESVTISETYTSGKGRINVVVIEILNNEIQDVAKALNYILEEKR